MHKTTYHVVTYYKRNTRIFTSKLAAEQAIRAHALTSKAPHYTELWEIRDDDGVQLVCYENSHLQVAPI